MYEPEAEEALKKWSSNRYALFRMESQATEEAMITEDKDHNPDAFYHAKAKPGDGQYRVTPSDYWSDEGYYCPEGWTGVKFMSRMGMKYGTMGLNAALPDLAADYPDGVSFTWGLELGAGGWYIVRFILDVYNGSNRLRGASAGMGDDTFGPNITRFLPDDAFSAGHRYAVRVTEGIAELWIDNEPRVFYVDMGFKDKIPSWDAVPYVVVAVPHHSWAKNMPVFHEFNPRGAGGTLDITPKQVRWGEISPKPPRTWRLYDHNADTLLTAGTYDTGTSHKSHPIPVKGYEERTLFFRADTDSVSGGLRIEVLTQEENWRLYDSVTSSANSLETYTITGEFPLVRIGYEPSANGASITDAEMHLR